MVFIEGDYCEALATLKSKRCATCIELAHLFSKAIKVSGCPGIDSPRPLCAAASHAPLTDEPSQAAGPRSGRKGKHGVKPSVIRMKTAAGDEGADAGNAEGAKVHGRGRPETGRGRPEHGGGD